MGGQMAVRKNNIAFTALSSYDEALAQEYQKGEVSGIYQACFMLPTMIEAYRVEIDKKQLQEDKEDA